MNSFVLIVQFPYFDFFLFGHVSNILTPESEFQSKHVREAKCPVHVLPVTLCHTEHSLCAAGERTNPGALFVGTAACIFSHPHT